MSHIDPVYDRTIDVQETDLMKVTLWFKETALTASAVLDDIVYKALHSKVHHFFRFQIFSFSPA